MVQPIFVKLTEAEIAVRSRTLAEKVCVLESLRLQKKEEMHEIGTQIKAVEEEIQELATTIRSGHEERDAQMALSGVVRQTVKLAE